MGTQRTRIRYADGRCSECVIVRLCGRAVRAVVAGVADAVDFRLVLDDWVSDRGEVVSFEFGGSPDQAGLCAMAGDSRPECAAGGRCMLRRIAGSALAGPVN